MPFKINISDKIGKTYKLELESEELIGKELRKKLQGQEILPALDGYELEITGTSDKAGFPASEDIEGIGLRGKILTYGKGMKKRPRKEGKKKYSKNKPKGLRLRKTMRGKTISQETSQINMKVIKYGKKSLAEIFPEQNKPKEPEQKAEAKAE